VDQAQASAAGYVVFLLIVLSLVAPVGTYLAKVFAGERVWLSAILEPVERVVYRIGGVDPKKEQDWKAYLFSFIAFSLAGTLAIYALLRCQQWMPFYDAKNLTTPMSPDLAMNTAVSFQTTSTWQAYGGETTMSYISQMTLTASNFMAGASGLAIGIAFIRGLSRDRSDTLGNFWVDLMRAVLYVLLPLSIIGAAILIALGVPMNFLPYTEVTTLEGARQLIAQGPVASLEIIKNLGTNGGGFFSVNAAHPFETPNNAANLLNLLAIAVLPAALTRTFGIMTNRRKDGWVLFGVMVVLFAAGLAICDKAERGGNPHISALHVSGSNMEGKEARFGVSGSVLAAITTSNGATGSTNSAPDSYTPIGVLVPLSNMLLGEMVFGGLGTGIYSIVLVAVLGLFICGLMVGRTPDYLGKTIGKHEIQLIVLYTLAAPFCVLLLTALAVVTGPGVAGLTTNDGPHGFTEIIFAFTSSFANNGQSMGGLSANSAFYNITTAIAMMAGRFLLAVPALALAGAFAKQGRRPFTMGTLPSDGLMFGVIIVSTVILLTLLSFFPALALGPIVEHYRLH